MVSPDEVELISFFEDEGGKIGGTCFLYSFTDKNNVTIYFSFDVVANDVQIKLRLNNNDILTIVQEGIKEFSIENDLSGQYICYYYETNNNIVKCIIKLSPFIYIDWANLLM